MVHSGKWLALALCAQLLAGCARRSSPATSAPPGPITVSGAVAYAHSIAEVRRAYRVALEERGLRVEVDSAGDLQAAGGPAGSPGLVRVIVGPSDTLMTRATITYRYQRIGNVFYHYPFHLPQLARRHLDGAPPVVRIAHAIVPDSLRSCPPVRHDTTASVEWPSLVGGAAALARRVQYTEEARAAEVEGVVYLGVVVDAEGRVTCVEVLSSLPHGLTESAVRVVATATFTPARQHGRPIAARAIQPVWFRLLD